MKFYLAGTEEAKDIAIVDAETGLRNDQAFLAVLGEHGYLVEFVRDAAGAVQCTPWVVKEDGSRSRHLMLQMVSDRAFNVVNSANGAVIEKFEPIKMKQEVLVESGSEVDDV